MRRIGSLFMALTLILSLAACGSTEEGTSGSESSVSVSGQETPASGSTEDAESDTDTAETAEETAAAGDTEESSQDSRILVAYYSWADNAVLAEDVDAVASPSVIPPGNVQQLAGWVQEATGGDLFSIQVTDPYPSDWDACLERANQERGNDARPELAANVENMDQYDVVFLGYPNWWYGVPMALLSFLEQNDLSGKEVYLFCSHGTGGLANSVSLITEAAPGAVISDNIFDCYEEDASSSQENIQNWVAELGYAGTDSAETEADDMARQIAVQFGDNTVIYELNDSTAADSLYTQLPLTVEVEDYSTNEKIFYPPQELDTGDAPTAQSGAGTLAYYAPWGDVVMFYDAYSPNASLYELGQAVSGGELVGQMTGTVTIDIAE